MAWYGGRDTGKLLLKRLRLAGLLALLVVASAGVWNVFAKERESAELRSQSEEVRNELLAREGALKRDLGDLKTDRGMEQALREQYALASRGEEMIIIVEEGSSATSSTRIRERRWFDWFFSWF